MTSSDTLIHVSNKLNQFPGPGQYEINSIFGKETPKYSISNKIIEKQNISTAPYQMIKSSIGNGLKYSLRSRIKENENNNKTPGPLWSPPQFGSNSPRIYFHLKKNEKNKEILPGPGQYIDPKLFSKEKEGPKIVIKSRKFIKDEPENCSPGPAAFNPNYLKILPNVPSVTILSGRKENKNEILPGPGQYNINNNYSPRPISFKIKKTEKKQEITPGPGEYVHEYKTGHDSPHFSIRIKPPEKEKNLIRAPYQKIPDKFGVEAPKINFHIRTRIKNSNESTPGPYCGLNEFGKDSPKFSISHKIINRKIEETSPGPNYLPNDENIKKIPITIKSRKFITEKIENLNPGPGSYNPNFNSILNSKPEITIKNKIIDNNKLKEGVSNYFYISKDNNSPKFTISKKYNHNIILGK